MLEQELVRNWQYPRKSQNFIKMNASLILNPGFALKIDSVTVMGNISTKYIFASDYGFILLALSLSNNGLHIAKTLINKKGGRVT